MSKRKPTASCQFRLAVIELCYSSSGQPVIHVQAVSVSGRSERQRVGRRCRCCSQSEGFREVRGFVMSFVLPSTILLEDCDECLT